MKKLFALLAAALLALPLAYAGKPVPGSCERIPDLCEDDPKAPPWCPDWLCPPIPLD